MLDRGDFLTLPSHQSDLSCLTTFWVKLEWSLIAVRNRSCLGWFVFRLQSELAQPHLRDFAGSFCGVVMSVTKPTLCVGCCLRSISSLSLTSLTWQHFPSVLLDYFFLIVWLFGRQPILRLLTGKIKKPFGEVSPSVQQDLFGRDGVGLAVNLYMLFFIKRKSQRQNGLPAAVLWGVSCQQSPLNFCPRTLHSH